MSDKSAADLLAMTADIVAAHLSHIRLAPEAVPALIQSIHRSLATIGMTETPVPELTPAVPVKKSVFPEYIVCLEDGKQLKTLKRHLQTSFGLSPDAYRARWGLPASYPMVAPAYASRRSELAKSFGLGRKPGETPPAAIEPEVTIGKARLARGSRG